METNELYLRTAFCCMACDGDIAKEEVDIIRKMTDNDNIFDGLDIQEKLNEYVTAINSEGQRFLNNYLEDIKKADFDETICLQLIRIAINTIEADNQIKYSEISFFKRLRKQLAISDEAIIVALPDKEDYLLPDVNDDLSSILDSNYSFDTIQIL